MYNSYYTIHKHTINKASFTITLLQTFPNVIFIQRLHLANTIHTTYIYLSVSTYCICLVLLYCGTHVYPST